MGDRDWTGWPPEWHGAGQAGAGRGQVRGCLVVFLLILAALVIGTWLVNNYEPGRPPVRGPAPVETR